MQIIGSGGVLGSLSELLKSRIERAYRLDERSAENAFILSATSHMAEKAFDKHVEFCEKYVQEVNKGLSILFMEGPTTEALEIAYNLSQIRREFVLWETKDVALVLSRALPDTVDAGLIIVI